MSLFAVYPFLNVDTTEMLRIDIFSLLMSARLKIKPSILKLKEEIVFRDTFYKSLDVVIHASSCDARCIYNQRLKNQ